MTEILNNPIWTMALLIFGAGTMFGIWLRGRI